MNDNYPKLADNIISMIKKIIVVLIIIHLSVLQGLCVCPVTNVVPVKEIELRLKERLPQISEGEIQFNKTPSGYIISIKNDLLFDANDCINKTGEQILNTMAQVMKDSCRRWLILGHTNVGDNPEHRIQKTSIKTNLITSFLTDIEKCLINQLFPIGFGSIMPNKFVTTNFQGMHERTDFVVEEFSLN